MLPVSQHMEHALAKTRVRNLVSQFVHGGRQLTWAHEHSAAAESLKWMELLYFMQCLQAGRDGTASFSIGVGRQDKIC